MISSNARDKSIVEEAYDWHLRVLEADISVQEQQALDEWVRRSPDHALAYRKAQCVVSAIDGLALSDFDEDVRQPLRSESLRHRWYSRVAKPFSWPLWATAGSSLAAMAMVLVVLQRSPAPGADQVEAPVSSLFSSERGETKTVTLRDGSVITLGAATTLRVTYQSEQRHASLDAGDALFRVASDPSRPFRVQSGDLTVEVLGTTFDVRNNGGVARVAVAEGSVAVRHPVIIADKVSGLVTTERLLPGQQITAANRTLGDIAVVDPKAVGSWQAGRFEYRRAALSEVVSDLNRYSVVPIALDDPDDLLSQATVTAIFDGQDPELMLERLPRILPVAIDRSDPKRLAIRPRTAIAAPP
ncbi:MAG: FecR domain-containing protein [Pseudomonadota bacterium]